jgi:hypothetical protein
VIERPGHCPIFSAPRKGPYPEFSAAISWSALRQRLAELEGLVSLLKRRLWPMA